MQISPVSPGGNSLPFSSIVLMSSTGKINPAALGFSVRNIPLLAAAIPQASVRP